MKPEVERLVNEYLNFSGERTEEDFVKLLRKVTKYGIENIDDTEAICYLLFILDRLEVGMHHVVKHGSIIVVVDEERGDIDEWVKRQLENNGLGKLRPKKFKELGKLVDEGEVPTSRSRADQFWKKRLKVIFTPGNKELRSGAKIPPNYLYDDIDFLERHYNLKAIEFGNWLSQQDRKNYLAGLGIALFDLCSALGISPKSLSFKKHLTVAFGARGRGASLAHFEPDTFAINLTRYSRPSVGSTLRPSFERTKLLTKSGGVGAFAHEYGHALDYFGGLDVEHRREALSDGKSQRTKPDKKLLAKKTAIGLMERLLYKIIWKDDKTYSNYYLRLTKKAGGKKLSKYYTQRNEIFARAFESYVHYKMAKKKHKNIFLAESKYDERTYLTPQEMKKLEPVFDALIRELKKHM